MIIRSCMSSGTRLHQRGAVLLGVAGGMLVVAGGLAGGYYVVGTRSEAQAATATPAKAPEPGKAQPSADVAAKSVDIKIGAVTTKMTWAALGIGKDGELDRDAAAKVLLGLKAKYD